MDLAGVPRQVVHKLVLMVSELVTNCVRHGRLREDDMIRLILDISSDQARVEVTQPGPPFEQEARSVHRHPPEGGFGLRIVESLADRWGVSGPPCTVWLEMGWNVPRR